MDDPLLVSGSEPLVPILQVDAGQVDPGALATWHQALSNTVAVEVPHDLMALWLYPSQGGVILLGPTELAADDLPIPVPSDHLRPEQLFAVEEIVIRAGYESATCLPVRFGKRDVAMLLVADLRSERYGPAERVLLQCVAQRIGPMLGRIARQWGPVEISSTSQQERIAGLLEVVSRANRRAGGPRQFLGSISGALAALIPHDHLELLLPNSLGDQYFRLGEHAGGHLWADPSLAISAAHLNVGAIFGSQANLLVPDSYEDSRWPRGLLSDAAGGDIRAIIGARLDLGSGSVAYLLAGSVGPDIYGADDVELLGLLAGLVAPQIGGFVRTAEPQRKPETLSRIAGLLAAASDPVSAAGLIVAEAARLLPTARLTVALRVAEEDRVILVEPGEQRAFDQLPQVPISETTLGPVLQGEVPHSLVHSPKGSRLIVPLRAAGLVHGALIFGATGDALNESDFDTAQQLADITAADLELLRIVSMPPAPKSSDEDRVEPASPRPAARALPATPPLRTQRRALH